MNGTSKSATSQITFFASLCLFLSAVEYAIPHPVPFLRLGLANLPIMLSLQIFRRRDTILLCVLKILGQSILSGTIFSYIFLLSAAGSFASCLLMMAVHAVLWRTQKISWIGISIVGAFANNVGQLLISRLMIFGENTKLIAPLLLAVSLVMGILLGIFANEFTKRSVWWSSLTTDTEKEILAKEENCDENVRSAERHSNNTATFASVRSTRSRIPITLRRCCVSESTKAHFPFKLFPFIRNSFFTTFAITLFALFTPQGKVLFVIGKWRITQGALVTGLIKSAKLVGMVLVSKLFVSFGFKFPGRVGQFVNQVIEGFHRLTSEKIELKGKGIIQVIDEVIDDPKLSP